ncbi:vitellin-degrading protease-like [Eurosta solidaginis]|uniref:vitellin-degrading protease-like n=1 Tax=Eurosta solidaginis TaxID=178769 RepID=UPI003530E3AF
MNIRNNIALLFALLGLVLSYTNGQFRIIDGEVTDVKRRAHSAAIFQTGLYICFGSIVACKLVVTAAHCVKGGQRRYVWDVHYYCEDNPETQFMNIAILQLTEPFKLNGAVQVIELCNDRLVPGSWMVIIGWDHVKKVPPSHLLKTKLVEIKKCENENKNLSIPENLAEITVYAGPQGDMWFGDSGAAGVMNERLCAVAQGRSRVASDPGIYLDLTNEKVRNFITTTMHNVELNTEVISDSE